MKKIPIWKNVILIVSVLVIIMVATFAWFVTGLTDGLVELTADVGEASFIQISDDHGNNWSEELDVDFGVNNNIKELSGEIEDIITYNLPENMGARTLVIIKKVKPTHPIYPRTSKALSKAFAK
jgi:hypothetical protein